MGRDFNPDHKTADICASNIINAILLFSYCETKHSPLVRKKALKISWPQKKIRASQESQLTSRYLKKRFSANVGFDSTKQKWMDPKRRQSICPVAMSVYWRRGAVAYTNATWRRKWHFGISSSISRDKTISHINQSLRVTWGEQRKKALKVNNCIKVRPFHKTQMTNLLKIKIE